eukprot:gene24032-27192_t
MAMLEIIASVSLRGQLVVDRGSFIVDDCWNLLVVRRANGTEAAVFAVVTDDIDVTKVEDSWVQAQVLDYLVKIASYDGQKYVFGGVTNYQQWRLCCLPNTATLAESEELLLDNDNNLTIDFCSASRAVVSSQVFSFDSPELIPALESLLLRSFYSPVVPRTALATHTHMYIDVSQDQWVWMVVHSEAPATLFYPDTPSVWYTLLYHIDSSYEEGNVWLARTDSGAVVMLKFPARKQQSWSTCVVEAGVWLHLWGVPVRTVRLLDSVALELPFFYQCALEPDLLTDQGKEQVQEGNEEGTETATEAAEADDPASQDTTALPGPPPTAGKEKKRNRWTLRRQKKKQAKAVAITTATVSESPPVCRGPSPQPAYQNRLYFTGLALSSVTSTSSSSALESSPEAHFLKGLDAQLQRLAADPLGTARAALSHLVLDCHLCLRDQDVNWSNLGVLPQEVRREPGTEQAQVHNDRTKDEQWTVRLVPVVTQLGRLQVVPGGPDEAQASLDHMLDLLEMQLREEE